MVLMNAGNRARHTQSITNQDQGGGVKKAGLIPRVAKDHWFPIYTHKHTKSIMVLSKTANPKVQQSRPIGGRPDNYIGAGGRY